MADFNPRKVAIAHIRKPLAELEAENKVYINGQFIVAIDEIGRPGLKVGEWDWETEPMESAPTFLELDWFIKPEQAGSGGYTPFKVRINSLNFAPDGDDVVITDPRLIGADEPVVYNTANNAEFRDEDLEINAVDGILRIKNFTLDAGEHITVSVPSIIKAADSVSALLPRIDQLEVYAQPFSVGGGIIIWKRPAADIPAGWQEVTELAGKTIVGYDPDDPDFNAVWTKTGGTKSHKINSANNLSKFSLFTIVDQVVTGAGHPSELGRAVSSLRSLVKAFNKTDSGGKESYDAAGSNADNFQPTLSPTSTLGKDDPDAIIHMNPYRIVDFIEPKPAA